MWNNLRTEYKLLIIIGAIFLVIATIFMLKNDTIGKAIKENKIENLRDCVTYDRGNYADYTCTIKDEKGESFTINYPQLTFETIDAKNVNRVIENLYKDSLNNLYYITDSEGKLQLTDYTLINYDVYEYNNILSIVISYNMISSGEEFYNRRFRIYNFSLETQTLISNDDLKDKLGIDRNFASNLKSEIVKMYVNEHFYDYYGELENHRNNLIDSSIGTFTYSTINEIYIKNDGSINILLNLNDPNYGFQKYYLFSYLNGKYTYSFVDTKAPTNGVVRD